MNYETLEEQSRLDTNSDTTSAESSTFDHRAFFKEHLRRTDDDDGYEVVGNDFSPMELALLETEKRRRGSQADSSRARVKADKYALELKKLREVLPKMEHRQTQIDDSLKYTDPDKYIELVLEAKQQDPYAEVFNTVSQEAANEVSERTIQTEIEMFNSNNPGQQLSIEQLENDIPPRLLNDFAEGKLSPQGFLSTAAATLYPKTEVYNPDVPVTPNLNTVGGQTTPTDDGSNDTMLANYASAIF